MMNTIKYSKSNKYQLFFLTGGPTNEAFISRQSYQTFFRAVKAYAFLEIHTFDGNTDGSWKYIDPEGRIRYENLYFSRVIEIICQASCPLVVPIIHGQFGEDGKLASVFETLKIPCLFSSSQVCALTLNKYATCKYLQHFGIAVPESILLFHWQNGQILETIKQWLEKYTTLVLKPVDEGSSFNMTVTSSEKEIRQFLETYWKKHQVLMVEECIPGREYTVGVYEDFNGEMKLLPPIRILPLESHYFDYDAKYIPGKSEETFNIELSFEKQKELCSKALYISRIFQIRGLSRSDFIYNTSNQQFYFLEINTIPGFTSNSLVPKAVREAGFTLEDFIVRLLSTAFRDKDERKNFLSCFK